MIKTEPRVAAFDLEEDFDFTLGKLLDQFSPTHHTYTQGFPTQIKITLIRSPYERAPIAGRDYKTYMYLGHILHCYSSHTISLS